MSAAEVTTLHNLISALNLNDHTSIVTLITLLDQHSKSLAGNHEARVHLVTNEPDLWPNLFHLWSIVANAHITTAGDYNENDKFKTIRVLCMSVAKFTRNLVAAVPSNQQKAFKIEPFIRSLLHYYTSYSATQAEESLTVTRMLVQALSNIVTTQGNLIQQLWGSYLNLPEKQSVLLRLLEIPDAKTATSTFVLILNCIHSSQARVEALASGQNGPRLCIFLLDRIASVFELEETPDSNSAFQTGFQIFTLIVNAGIIPDLYDKIAMEGEVITPHQTTLLKLLDSYLQPSQSDKLIVDEKLLGICTTLITIFFTLSEYTQKSIQRSVGSHNKGPLLTTSMRSTVDSSAPSLAGAEARVSDTTTESHLPQELDLMLPKVCEALVLVTQCLTSLALFSEDVQPSPGYGEITNILKNCINGSVSPASVGSIECLIETLRLLDLFLPRITLGRTAPAPVHVDQIHNAARSFHTEAAASIQSSSEQDPKGFAYLKRDLVRLLGVLCTNERVIQDRVRVCGGITVVLNLCVIDDRNPYLREHAILTLRNLLDKNVENQTVVQEIQPVEELISG